MKKSKAQMPFVDQLMHAIKTIRRMKPGDVHILSINANYGHYQIVISASREEAHRVSIEINGEIHHLFVTPRKMRAQPSRRQVQENLKDTVIIRNLSIHLYDPRGDGRHLVAVNDDDNGIHPRECINLAGQDGERLMDEVEHSRRYSLEAYKIVQQDILNALKKEEAA